MATAKNKTQETDADVGVFISTITPEKRQQEAHILIDVFRRSTGQEPKMWGPSMIGFGSYNYKYDSGREGTSLRTGFSPRRAKLSLYLMGAYSTPEAQVEQRRLLGVLGKYSMGQSCLYISRLDQIDLAVLEQLIRNNWELMNQRYPI